MTSKSKDYDCGGETVGVAIEAVRTLKSPSESERFTIPTKQKSRSKRSAFLCAKFDSSLKGNVVFAVISLADQHLPILNITQISDRLIGAFRWHIISNDFARCRT